MQTHGSEEDWDLNLGCLAASFRATPSSSSEFTPNMLMLGREARIPAELRNGRACDSEGQSVNSYGEYVNWLRDRLQAAHDIAREHLENAAKRHKYAYDTKLEHLCYEQGECAWYLHEKRVPGVSPKLQPKYVLCVVLKKLSDVTYLIRLGGGGNRVVHHDKLKKYERLRRPKWMDRAICNYKKGN